VLRVEARGPRGDLALDVALSVPPGRCLALAGPSGAGKTTILRVVAGLTRPRAGRVVCAHDVWLDTAAGTDVPPERRSCGYVFQDYALFAHRTAWQNVAYGLRRHSRHERRARALELLARFDVDTLADRRPPSLSGGERQRVALARALATRPRVLLLDEPLAALDSRTRASAARALAGTLHEAEFPALLVTHDFAEAAVLGDRVGIVDGGRIVQEGTAAELAASPRSAFVADFTGAVVLTGSARRAEAGLTAVDLDGGGLVFSVDRAEGPVAASVHPWEITLEPAGAPHPGSAQNHLDTEVLSITPIGSRARVGLVASQPLTAEITTASAQRLALAPGQRVVASWKAAATRLMRL
jgi:molybdate transport system ATP-binding protein